MRVKKAYLVIVEGDESIMRHVEALDIEETLVDKTFGLGHDVDRVVAMPAENISRLQDAPVEQPA